MPIGGMPDGNSKMHPTALHKCNDSKVDFEKCPVNQALGGWKGDSEYSEQREKLYRLPLVWLEKYKVAISG
ncbi:hypothetical protein ACFCT7_05980 [Fulvivirgaceae bacterium LMO-SS25]